MGALSNLGYRISDQTVGNILKAAWHRASTETKPEHNLEGMHSIPHGGLAGIDFFTVEIFTWRGLVIYYVLFFIHLESRRVSLAGITPQQLHGREDIPKPNYVVNKSPDQLAGFVESSRVRKGTTRRLCGSWPRSSAPILPQPIAPE